MPFERPTFHESWYRVAELHPRLRSTVQISRQHFRGQPWHVVQDHTNDAFFRLSEPAYRFVGLLDGKRSVEEAWRICADQLGDDAPTQGEAIQLLGQLYTSNLLQAELPADTHGLFARFKKRKRREVQSYLMNLMFIRIPVLDPDAFLERWMPLFGWIFSPVGLVVWLGLIAGGFWMLSGDAAWGDRLLKEGRDVMRPGNLILLYLGFALIKGCHEFGHAISCKKFGMRQGVGGEVHVMGIMFLVFSPVPYVDASSSWALKSKWRRMVVGAAGMWVELAIAAICAMVWARTNPGATVHTLAYNMMFVASVSTLLFNANPLLRYDGYYMLSDLLEIPNLAQRGKEFLYYLVKKYAWGVRPVRNPAHSFSEQGWLFVYAIASGIMRVVVSFGILFYLANVLEGVLIILATAMALAGVVTWVFVPIGKFLHYLATSPELARVRVRAVTTTALAVGAAVAGVGMISAPDRARAPGVVELEAWEMPELYVEEDGFVRQVASDAPRDEFTGMPKVEAGTAVLVADNPALRTELAELKAELRRLTLKRNMAMMENPGDTQAWQNLIKTQEELIRDKEQRIAALTLAAPVGGLLVAEGLEHRTGMYLQRGAKIGSIARVRGLGDLRVRVTVPNDLSGPLNAEADKRVEIRLEGRPEILLSGRIRRIMPAGQTRLPSASLGYAGGGQMAVSSEDQKGLKTTEPFFEVELEELRFEKNPENLKILGLGQRVTVRFELTRKPLAQQAWTSLLQLIQKRFHT